jgi:hypothetical protein
MRRPLFEQPGGTIPQIGFCAVCPTDQTDLLLTGRNHPSIRRNTIADDANPAAPFAAQKGLPFGISRKEGATVTN